MTENNANVIKGLKPERLWYHFAETASTPRPSLKEEKIRDYIVEFATKHNLKYKIDKIGNVVIYKQAQNTKSNKTIILQSHMDMVCESNSDIKIDFENDLIILRKDGDLLRATGTTLGADNGIGIAMMLAILENKDMSHSNIEALFTIDEESGLTGAMNFDKNMLSGEYLINLDSEEEDIAYIGAAGGETSIGKYSLKKEYIKPSDDLSFTKITINGLRGGHSGGDIHKNYGNAIKFIGHILTELINNNIDFYISYISGGKMKNAIPRYAEVIFGIDNNKKTIAENLINTISKKITDNYKNSTEPNIKIKIESSDKSDKVLSKKQSNAIINIINTIHHGVYRMSTVVKNLVETSSNLGVVKWENDYLEITCLTRSDDMFEVDLAVQQIISSLKIIDEVEIIKKERFPAWKPIPIEKNPFLQKYVDTFTNLTGKNPYIMAIHAGLECGYFVQEMPDIQVISIGPDIKNVHSPDENVSISSTERFWKILIEFIKIL